MFEQQIAAGMQLLDEKMPGWADQINVGTLDLNMSSRCVLGQLMGDFFNYDVGALFGRAHSFTWDFEDYILTDAHGFSAGLWERDGDNSDVNSPGSTARYYALTNEWRAAINARRGIR